MKTAALIVAALVLFLGVAFTYKPAYFVAQDAEIAAVVLEYADGNAGPKQWITVVRMRDSSVYRASGRLGATGDKIRVRLSPAGGLVVCD